MVEVETRVLYGDTDRMGHANHASFLKWFEQGRAEFLRGLGMSYAELEKRGYFLPVSESYCRYQAPAYYDDLITVQASLGELGRASMKFDYLISRKEDGARLATGFTAHVCLNREGKICRLPPFLSELLKKGLSGGSDGTEPSPGAG